MRLISWSFLLIIMVSCQSKKAAEKVNNDKKSSVSLKYSKGFTIDNYDGYKVVKVVKPHMNAETGFEYILATDVSKVPDTFNKTNIIKTPLESIVCTSTTHIPLLDYLNLSDKLIGFPTTDYISSEKMRERIDAGLVTDLGVDNEMNIELLADIAPDLVMAYTIGGDYGQFQKIQQLNINTVINAEYLEEHPLGRAEWIKFMAAFFNEESSADSVFNMIESNYLELRKNVATQSQKPSVFSGVVYGDTWYLPGGQNYASKLINDAGGNYLWNNDSTSGFLELSFEAVYEKANEADFWIGVASFETLSQIREADIRYTSFNAFKNEKVYTNNWRKGAKGGSEFLELGYLRPDIILNDLIQVFHPNLMDDEGLYFHKKLEQ